MKMYLVQSAEKSQYTDNTKQWTQHKVVPTAPIKRTFFSFQSMQPFNIPYLK